MALLKVSSTTIRKRAEQGFFKTFHVGLRGEFFARDEAEEILKWLEEGGGSSYYRERLAVRI